MSQEPVLTDTIVDEVHRIRQEIMAECGGSLEALCERLMAQQERHGERLVHPPSRSQERSGNEDAR